MLPSTMRSSFLLTLMLSSTSWAQDAMNPCKSFGIDFQDKGAYFQNGNSTDPFTFVSEFEGCQPDMCLNVLVDPFGESYECTETPLTPDRTPQLSTCPRLKNQLVSGPWSVILMSNNLGAGSIAYQRDFDLSVGEVQTVTITPTITVPITSTFLINATSTVIDVAENVTLPASTVFAASTTIVRTRTVTPRRVTRTSTKVVATVTRGRPSISVVKTTKIVIPTCTVPPRQPTRDPKLHFRPKLNVPHAQQMLEILRKAVPNIADAPPSPPRGSVSSNGNEGSSANFRTWQIGRSNVKIDKEAFLKEREQRMAKVRFAKRAQDEPIVTVNATNPAAYPTITNTVVLSSTATITETVETTATITPPAVTIVSGKEFGPRTTVTAPTPTRVITRNTVITIYPSKVITQTITLTSTTTPPASASACRRRGGHFKRG